MKLNFEEAIQAINEERFISRDSVQSKALMRKVWIAEWHVPGCLSESQCVMVTKKDAIESSLKMAEGEDGPPKGMLNQLTKNHQFSCTSPLFGHVISTIRSCRLEDLL